MPDPTRIGRYLVQRPLGSGAFAVVWLGRDEVLDAPVAIKVLAENWLHHADVRGRFIDEAKVLRRADSDLVVRVFDIGELDDGKPYFVMSFADRGSLADRLAAGPLPVATSLRLGVEIARAVSVLHDIGVLHRDVKPSNVLFRSDGRGERVMIGDLGLAKELAQASGFTVTAGTPGYMAPEQGDNGATVDERADVYGIGATVYRTVTGQVPGYGDTTVVRPRVLRPELPVEADEVIMRALQRDPSLRWPNAGAFAAALDSLAEQAGTQRPQRSRVKRHRGWLLSALLLLVLGAGGVAWSIIGLRDEPALTVRVSDDTGRIRFDVPAGWAGQRQGGGWSTTDIGLPPEPGAPGVAVAENLTRWRDRTSITPGMFVGVTDDPNTKKRVAAIAHDGCSREPSVRPAGQQPGVSIRWRCGRVEYVETALRADSGSWVYLQVKQPADGPDHTEQILQSLRVR